MNARTVGMVLFWAFAIVAPIIASVLAASVFPAGVEVPMHWNIHGDVDSWRSPWTMVPTSLIMAGCNGLFALCYRFSDFLYDHGLVHGVSRRATRPFLCGTAVFMVVLWVGILAIWVTQSLGAMG